jgi:hypothetical protein
MTLWVGHLGSRSFNERGLINEGHLRYLPRQDQSIERSAPTIVIPILKMRIEHDRLLLMEI